MKRFIVVRGSLKGHMIYLKFPVTLYFSQSVTSTISLESQLIIHFSSSLTSCILSYRICPIRKRMPYKSSDNITQIKI